MLKAIIFDMDGTLIDSVDYHAQAWREAFEDFGYRFHLDAIRVEIGKGGDQLLPVFLTPDDIERRGKDLQAHRSDLLKERYLREFAPFPGVRELFQRLSDDGIKRVVASSSTSEDLETCKILANIEDLVDDSVSSEDAESSKPTPDIFEAALGRLSGLDASDIVVIGDTPHDAVAARRAGLRTIGVLCGGVSESVLRDSGCVAIFRGPSDLLDAYGSWISGDLPSLSAGSATMP